MKAFYPAVSACVLIAAVFITGCPANKSVKARQVSIDGEVITEEQARVEGAEQLQELELKMLQNKASFARDEHEILQQAFERIIDETLIDMEAKKRGIPKEKLLETEIGQKIQEPTEEEMNTLYAANRNRISASKEDVLPQIREYLIKTQETKFKQDLLANLEKEHNVVRNLDYLRFDVEAPGRPSTGPATAPVVMVEFSDFQCSYCKAFSGTLKRVLEQYGDKVRLVYRHFPLSSIHPDAERAAEASQCAADQNRFWEIHDLLFENSRALKEKDILQNAEQLGLDMAAFQSCLDGEKYKEWIEEDIRGGSTAGVEGTPALFINGRYLSGNQPFDEIVKIIDEELGNNAG